MSFLDDLLEDDASLTQGTVNDDGLVRELVENAVREGRITALRAAVARGQINSSAPEELVLRIVEIAGSRLEHLNANERDERAAFVHEWVKATLPDDAGQRQQRLDRLLQACYGDLCGVYDSVARQLLSLGANPLAPVQLPEPVATPAPAQGEAPAAAGRTVAVIGTAGRDKSIPMTKPLWENMLLDVRPRVNPEDTLVSGGAAWADHLAVVMFLEGRVKHLVLHLPAPLQNGRFAGPQRSAGAAANYYHGLFSQATGIDSLAQLQQAIAKGATVESEPEAAGYSAMFTRNAKVARKATAGLAYTFGTGDTPNDGGTKNTWDQIQGERVHVPLHPLLTAAPAVKPAAVVEAPPTVATPAGQPLAFVRPGIEQTQSTIFSQALYARSSIVAELIKACAGPAGSETDALPVVATLRRHGQDIGVNVAAYAVAIGEPAGLDQVLAALDPKHNAVREALGRAVDQIVALRLHEFGIDEVHHALCRLLAAGASHDTPGLTRLHTFVVQAPCLKHVGADSRIFDDGKALTAEEVARLQRFSLPAALLGTPNARHVAQALTELNRGGWNPGEPATFQADGTPGKTTVAHYAAVRGDESILGALRAMSADFKAVDERGRTPMDYALLGLNPAAASLIDPQVLRQRALQEAAHDQLVHQTQEEDGAQGSRKQAQAASARAVDIEDVNALLEEASQDGHADPVSARVHRARQAAAASPAAARMVP